VPFSSRSFVALKGFGCLPPISLWGRAPRRREMETENLEVAFEQLCFTRDEGRFLGLGLQDQGPNHRKLRRHNGRGGERCEKGGGTPSGVLVDMAWTAGTKANPIEASISYSDFSRWRPTRGRRDPSQGHARHSYIR
jgi:hypothetical protein